MSKKHLEANLRSKFAKFAKDIMGRGPKNVSAHIWENILIFKSEGVLTPEEKYLVKTPKGEKLVFDLHNYFVYNRKEYLDLNAEEEFGNKPEYIHFNINKEKDVVYTFYIMEKDYSY